MEYGSVVTISLPSAALAAAALAPSRPLILRCDGLSAHVTGYASGQTPSPMPKRSVDKYYAVLNIDLDAGLSVLCDSSKRDWEDFPTDGRLVRVVFRNCALRYTAPAAGGRADARLHALGNVLWNMYEDGEDTPTFGQSVLKALLEHLHSSWCASLTPITRGGLAPWQQRLAEAMMGTDLLQPVQLQQVASRCRLSLSQFTRSFRQSTGCSPHRWLVTRRVAQAKGLLGDSTSSLVDIALCCGFADQSHFTRVFRQQTGLPPGQWRRLHQQDLRAGDKELLAP